LDTTQYNIYNTLYTYNLTIDFYLFCSGYEMSRIICQNRDTGVEVDADLCPGERPNGNDLSVECNSQPCPPK